LINNLPITTGRPLFPIRKQNYRAALTQYLLYLMRDMLLEWPFPRLNPARINDQEVLMVKSAPAIESVSSDTGTINHKGITASGQSIK
jgi:hypothetical protein